MAVGDFRRAGVVIVAEPAAVRKALSDIKPKVVMQEQPGGTGRLRVFETLRQEPVGESGDTPDFVLTPRLLEVLELIADGRTNRDIGKRLGVGEMTVKSHLTRLYKTLGVNGRCDAVAIGFRHGILGGGA